MNESQMGNLGFMLTALLLAACGRQPDFSTEGCNDGTEPAAVVRAIREPVKGTDYPGLHCVSYEITGPDQAEMGVINRTGVCVYRYEGWTNVPQPNRVEVTIEADKDSYSGSPPPCSCPFDFSFEVSGLDTGDDVRFELDDYHCADLPMGTADFGLACKYNIDYEGETQLHDHCHLDVDGGSDCGDGLLCEEVAVNSGNELVCLATCDAGTECPAPGALACSDGRCVISNELRPCEEID